LFATDAQHHLLGGFTNSNVEGTGPIPAVSKAYKVASAAACSNTADICGIFDELRAFVSESESLVTPIIAESRRLTVDNQYLRHEIEQRDEQLRCEIAQRDEQLRCEAERSRYETIQRDLVNERLRSNIVQLRELLSVWERELSDNTREIAELQESAVSVSARLKWREEQVAALEAELKCRKEQVAALEAELKWREAELNRREEQIAAQNEDLQRL
jgi:chromosome segregation ATPase